jgi:hypothetical protein
MGLTAGKKDHAEAGAAGAPGSEIRGSAGTNTGTSRVRSGGDGATSCLSPALVNKGLCQHRDHSGQQTQPLVQLGASMYPLLCTGLRGKTIHSPAPNWRGNCGTQY